MLDLEKLRAAGIDPEEGLAYCGEDPEFYGEMLEEYAREWRESAAELELRFAEGAWNDYGIRAHAVKSTSRTIGAEALAERARGLELAAKEGDQGSILAGHEAFLAEYGALAEAIRGALG